MYSFKEKKTHFVALRNLDVAQYDLELLAKEVPGFPQLATFSRNPKRYADDILYALLDCATREEIREYRRAMIAKKAKEAEDAGEKKTKGPATKKTAEKKQQMPEGETTHTEETGPHDDVEKPEAAPADNSAEELKQALEEAEARAEEAEQRADEAEDSIGVALMNVKDYSVGIDLEKALANPGSIDDVVLRDGDELYIPQMQSTVKMSGAVTYRSEERRVGKECRSRWSPYH